MDRNPNSGASVSIPVSICSTHKPSTVVVNTNRRFESRWGASFRVRPSLAS
jgi:hypothetical protein